MLIRKKSGEVIDVETTEVMDASDFTALIGREDDPVIQALVAEIRRLGTVLANHPNQIPPAVHVAPAISAPAVHVSPQVDVRMACLGVRAVVKRHEYGKNQGEIDYVDFIPLQP